MIRFYALDSVWIFSFPNISLGCFVSMRPNVFPFHLKKRFSVALFIRNEGGWNALVRDECVTYHRHGRGTTQAWPVWPTQTLYVLTRALAHTATLHLVCITLRSNKEGGTVLSCCIAVLSYCIAVLLYCLALRVQLRSHIEGGGVTGRLPQFFLVSLKTTHWCSNTKNVWVAMPSITLSWYRYWSTVFNIIQNHFVE